MPIAGPEYRLTVAELDAILAQDTQTVERRSQARIGCRHRAQLICLRADSPTVHSDVRLVWTEDVSMAGVKLLLPESLTADKFWMRFTGDVLTDPFVECHVQWRDELPVPESIGSGEELYRCGVKFQQSISREEFEKMLSAD